MLHQPRLVVFDRCATLDVHVGIVAAVHIKDQVAEDIGALHAR